MADIRTYPFISHLRADPTSWVQHQHNGKVRHVGAGLSFWFRQRTSALAEVPLDEAPGLLAYGGEQQIARDAIEMLARGSS